MSSAQPPRLLDTAENTLVADALGDTPETVISVHLIRRGLCRAYCVGDPARFAGVVIQSDELPAEPIAFGDDPTILWQLLQYLRGWGAANTPPAQALALGAIIEAQTGRSVRYVDDIYHTLSTPVAQFDHAAVRQLGAVDLPLLETAPADVRGSGYGTHDALLTDGVVAGAITQDRLVAIAYTSARTERHADISVATLAGWRGQGMATAAASLVIQGVQAAGQTPVWSVGETNQASLWVARKLGFREVSRRTYVVLPDDREVERGIMQGS